MERHESKGRSCVLGAVSPQNPLWIVLSPAIGIVSGMLLGRLFRRKRELVVSSESADTNRVANWSL